MVNDVLIETLKRTAGIAAIILPLLFVVEYLNHRYGEKLIDFFEKRKRVLPFWAALIALLPGCNAAAAVALLFTKGLVSIGALIAAMIATSDEALYVFIPLRFNFLPLFIAKFILAIVIGFAVDAFTRFSGKKGMGNPQIGYCCSIHEHQHGIAGMLNHTLRHGIKIILFIFLVLFGFNYIKDFYGFDQITKMVLSTGKYQPIFAGLFGMIPGCGTSVVLASLYTQGILTFGGALTGLSVASGDTILVLLANKVDKKEIGRILTIVLVASITAGYLLSFFL